MTEEKKTHITELPAGRYPLRIVSSILIINRGGAAKIRFTFCSMDKNNVIGEVVYDTALFTL